MMTQNPNECEQCGDEMLGRVEGGCWGLFCIACNWCGVVTTFIPPINLDPVCYQVCVRDGDFRNLTHVRVVADVLGVNFLSARTMLQRVNFHLFTGQARDVIGVRSRLVSAGMGCSIEPDFMW